MKPTQEQLTALEMFRTGESLAIEAGAGTGKTSTLRLLAEQAPNRGQYVAFNKAIVVEAKAKMPANIQANTAHSLAMRSVGRQFSHRLKSYRMKSIEVARALGLDSIEIDVGGNRKTLAAGFLAGLTMRGITRFCQSADQRPEPRHVPYVPGIDLPGPDGKPGHENNRKVSYYLGRALTRAWDDLCRPDGRLTYKHEHYLKLWQLSDPRIETDFILFDEAQDANPVMVAVVAAQTHAQLVWVGDSQQQIYTFTGAINALDNVPADRRTFLTRSFRFGPEIADTANDILGWLDAPLRLEGSPEIPSRLDSLEEPEIILTRTNAEGIRLTLKAQSQGRKVHIVGGGQDVVKFAQAADNLKQGLRTDHPELACFDNWGEVQDYVENDSQGGELKLLVDLCEEFGSSEIVAALGRMPVEVEADLVVSTAHKAKGREWETVKLSADFNATLSRKGIETPSDTPDDELRLLYVATTRAKQILDVEDVKVLSERATGGEDSPPAGPAVQGLGLAEWLDEIGQEVVK